MGAERMATEALAGGVDLADTELGPRRVLAVDLVGEMGAAFIFGLDRAHGTHSVDFVPAYKSDLGWQPLGSGGSWGSIDWPLHWPPQPWDGPAVMSFGVAGNAGPLVDAGEDNDELSVDAWMVYATGGFLAPAVHTVAVTDVNGTHHCDLRSPVRAFVAAGRERMTVSFCEASGLKLHSYICPATS